jgi:phospholipase C
MISIHTTRRLACVLAGLAGALAALSAASPAALAHRPPPPTDSGGSTQAQTPIHTIVTNGGRGAPRPAPAQRTSPIRHIVVIYLENHSFDNLLGFWCNANPGRCPQGGMPTSVTLSNGAVVSPSVAHDTVPEVLHTVASQVAAIDGGKMDGWQNIPDGSCDAATGYQCISGYQPAQLPNLIGLAQHFAISDNTFSLNDSESWASHIAIVSASQDHFYGDNPPSHGFPPVSGWGCDSGREALWITSQGTKMVPACVPDHSLNPVRYPYGGAFKRTPVRPIPTIMDRLQAAGLSWRIYGATKGAKGYGIWDICPTFAECLDTSQDANLVPDAQFPIDARDGKLPAFSVVTPGGRDFLNSCHNGVSMTACDNWAGKLVGAVERSPDWASTAVFITFDDCGCFYDQVPPPLDPAGEQEGPRVPLLIVSPYARPGYTDTQATTFAGILAYTEHTFGLAPLGVNDAQAYDFSNAFNYSQLPLKRAPMVQRPLPASARRIRVTPALANDPT